MSSTNSHIFNIEEVTGKEHSLLETTAAEARLEAPNRKEADEIDENAEKEQEVAEEAAAMAQKLGPRYTGEPAKPKAQPKAVAAGLPSASNNFYNAEEAAGNERSETTVDEARNEAPNFSVSYQVERNAKREQQAALQAASTAKVLGSKYTGEPSTAADEYHSAMDDAVAEGKRDVDQAKAAGAGYVEQAKKNALSAMETAQAYLGGELPSRTAESGAPNTSTRSVTDTETGDDALATIQSNDKSASKTAQPPIDNAYTTVKETQPQIENVKDMQEYLGSAKTTGVQPLATDSKLNPASAHNIPASSAPPQTGSQMVNSPYDRTTADTTASPSVHN